MTINCSRCIHSGPRIPLDCNRDTGLVKCALFDKHVIADQSCPMATEGYDYIESKSND